MGWNAETEWSRLALMRIVAMLFSLAALADRAAFSSRAARRESLTALRRGALAAQSLVLDAAAQFGATPDPAAPFNPFEADFSGDSPDDAMLLAHTFRSLGWALQLLVSLSPRGGATGAPGIPISEIRSFLRASRPRSGSLRRFAAAHRPRSPPA